MKKQHNHSVPEYLTFDVGVKFQSIEDKKAFTRRVREVMEDCMKMANDPEVQLELYDFLVKVKQEGKLRCSRMQRNAFIEHLYHNGFAHYNPYAMYHRSTVTILLQAIKTQLTFKSYIEIHKAKKPGAFAEFLIFGYSNTIAWDICNREGVSWKWVKDFLIGVGRKLKKPELNFNYDPHGFDISLRLWFRSLKKGKKKFQKEYYARAETMIQNPRKVFSLVKKFIEKYGKPSENKDILLNILKGNYPDRYVSNFSSLIGHLFQNVNCSLPNFIVEFSNMPILFSWGGKAAYFYHEPKITDKIKMGLPIILKTPYAKRKRKMAVVELKIREYIRDLVKRGAEFSHFILSLRRSGNLRVQVVLKDSPVPIARPIPIQVKKTDIIGVDLNRMGKYMVSCNVELPIEITQEFERLGKKYEVYLEEISHLHPLHPNRKILYGKQKEIRKVAHKFAARVIASLVLAADAKILVTERLKGISTKGKRGKLAKAIMSMGKDKVIMDAVAILKGWGKQIILIQALPWNVKFSTHHQCGGNLIRKRLWNVVPCDRCNTMVNTHENAAKLLADYGKNKCEKQHQA
ncbi:MAG: hypothetical protein D6732_13665 [Methanobacteriota archaeon]|nr:MAG: hypothetical protein D6732_13665 [Euryarchaeota archaeon]